MYLYCSFFFSINFNGEDSDEENDVKIKRIVEVKVREKLYTYRPGNIH